MALIMINPKDGTLTQIEDDGSHHEMDREQSRECFAELCEDLVTDVIHVFCVLHQRTECEPCIHELVLNGNVDFINTDSRGLLRSDPGKFMSDLVRWARDKTEHYLQIPCNKSFEENTTCH